MAGNKIPAKFIIFCKKRVFIITEDEDIDKIPGEEMGVIYEPSGEGFNFFKAQVRELNAERNQSILTSIFRTITGTRHKTRRRQVTGIPTMPITLGVASPTVMPSAATTMGMPVTTTTPAQEAMAVTTVLDTPAIVMPPILTASSVSETEHELSVPDTTLPVQPAINESQLGASYLNNCIHQVVHNTSISMNIF